MKIRFSSKLNNLMALIACIMIQSMAVASPAHENDSLKAQMVKDWERAKLSTKAYIDAMPEDGIDFRPTPETRSFAEQMLHIAQTNSNFVNLATGKKRLYDINLEKTEKYKNKTELRTVVMESYDFMIATIKEIEASAFTVAGRASPKYTCQRVLNAGFEHQAHHKGQTVIYLRLKSVQPPPEGLF